MKVLFVSSGNSAVGISPFVKEQGEALRRAGITLDYFLISGKGIRGYWRNIFLLRGLLKRNHYDILHGHFIWSILVCLFQRNIIKVGTFHGTDLNRKSFRWIADRIVMPFLDLSIVVSEKMASLVPGRKTAVIPCGIDLDTFYPNDDVETSMEAKIQEGKVNILFCSDFQRPVKNSPLAFEAIRLLNDKYAINFIELKGLDRHEVNHLLNRIDLLLMTSYSEGSPQIIKEAMACNCPIVSTDVGDVGEVVQGVEGCFISSFDPVEVADCIEKAIAFHGRTLGRGRIEHFSNVSIAAAIKEQYEKLVHH